MSKVLVIGAGGAGLSAAIKAKQNGSDVIVVTKEYPTRSQTCMAQGGINAALGKEDSIQKHIEDTFKSAKGLADKSHIELMCKEAINAIEWLDSIGVVFSRTADAKIAQRKLGGASVARACYAEDFTGLKILHALYDYALNIGVEFLNEHFLLDILIEDNTAYGAVFLDIKTSQVKTITSSSIILAGGGYSKIYGEYSTNSKSATGDIIAVAKKAGCDLKNMEYVQFHPTALKSSSILIGEAARGAGGKLFNSKGERFVDELKPRDEVSLAIFEQIKKGEDVFLDITHLGEEFINHELPQERKLALLYENIDPVKEKLPIKPAAHFTMGGIKIDTNTQTNITNLFACGECSEAGVHGANRLGGNALLEIVVFGKIAGENASKIKSNPKQADEKNYQTYIDTLLEKKPSINFYEKKQKLHNLMYSNCGIVRYEKELQEVLEFINECEANLEAMAPSDNSKTYNTNLVDFLEFKNSLIVAKEVVTSAKNNKTTNGAHIRGDV